MEPKTKAKPAPPYEGRPTWWGYYWQHERWARVCNQDGNPIIYKTPEAANAAAWLMAPEDEIPDYLKPVAEGYYD